jgi:hypothetical protein
VDLPKVVVTMAAVLTQDTRATQIRQHHGHSLLVAKDTHPSRTAASARLFTEAAPALPTEYWARYTTSEPHHGR